MKATGIIRRFDDMGRIAIPKAIRDKKGLKEGAPMEIYEEKDCVILKPYKDMAALESKFKALVDEIVEQNLFNDDKAAKTSIMDTIATLQNLLNIEK